jgi:hypothetical protein
MRIKTEWHRTASDLSEIPLPLICIIDPDSMIVYEDRTKVKTQPVFTPSVYTLRRAINRRQVI